MVFVPSAPPIAAVVADEGAEAIGGEDASDVAAEEPRERVPDDTKDGKDTVAATSEEVVCIFAGEEETEVGSGAQSNKKVFLQENQHAFNEFTH